MSLEDAAPASGVITIRPLAPADQPPWQGLYARYAAFYRTSVDEAILARTWGWLMAPAHPLAGLVATDATGRLVGLAHYRPFPEPLLGVDAGFLDDLFVVPACRGQRVGQRLMAAVGEVAREQGWPFVRWITAQDNARARRLYDALAPATSWVTYDWVPGDPPVGHRALG